MSHHRLLDPQHHIISRPAIIITQVVIQANVFWHLRRMASVGESLIFTTSRFRSHHTIGYHQISGLWLPLFFRSCSIGVIDIDNQLSHL